jgi:Resolvase, N terminal domain
MRPAYGYIRVSSDEQADSGLGLEAQRQRIRAYCEAKGLQLSTLLKTPRSRAASRCRRGLREAACSPTPGAAAPWSSWPSSIGCSAPLPTPLRPSQYMSKVRTSLVFAMPTGLGAGVNPNIP